MNFYEGLKAKFHKLVMENNLLDEEVVITGRTLSVDEAIGNPTRRDYPIVKGKEKLMQAEFRGAKGQAFTDMADSFKGTIKEILELPLENNFERAVFISAMNAVMRHLGLTEKTVHCHDDQPEQCAARLAEYVQKVYGNPKIALIGLQPAMLEKLSASFTVRVVDMDKENIGKKKSGVLVEGMESTEEVLDWCELIIATGSTVVNATITDYCKIKPVVFFGTTIAATASLMGFNRFCEMAS